MKKEEIQRVVEEIVQGFYYKGEGEEMLLPVEVSARHIHLSQEDVEILFGKEHGLRPKKMLSQPGEFLSEERLKIVTAKGEFHNVAVLGPTRKYTQVELSASDCKALGIQAAVHLSGDLKDAGDVYLISPKNMILAKGSVLIAKAHIHMTQKDAQKYQVEDGQNVKISLQTNRPLTIENCIVRVKEQFQLAVHIDVDEANACCLPENAKGKLIH